MFAKLFWLLAILLAALVLLYAAGWPVLSAIAALLLVDIVVAQLGSRARFKNIENDLRHEIGARFDGLERLCKDILVAVKPPTAEPAAQAAAPEAAAEARPETAPAEQAPAEQNAAAFSIEYSKS